jgi:hypothetical protein
MNRVLRYRLPRLEMRGPRAGRVWALRAGVGDAVGPLSRRAGKGGEMCAAPAIQDSAIIRALDYLDCRKLDAIPRDGSLGDC